MPLTRSPLHLPFIPPFRSLLCPSLQYFPLTPLLCLPSLLIPLLIYHFQCLSLGSLSISPLPCLHFTPLQCPSLHFNSSPSLLPLLCCILMVADGPPSLLFSNRHDLRLLPAAPSHEYSVIISSLRNTIAVDYHYAKKYVFWSDVIADKIYRGSMDAGQYV